jgi:hypothetical protein
VRGPTLFSDNQVFSEKGRQMLTTAGTDLKAQVFVAAALIGIAAMLPGRWRAAAKHVWSYGVYCVGYRMLSVQISCGHLAVSGVPFVMKCGV